MKLTKELINTMQFDFLEVVIMHYYVDEPFSVKETRFHIFNTEENYRIEGQMEQTINEGHAVIAIKALDKGKIQIRIQ